MDEITKFILELDALKLVHRKTYICGGIRVENSAEHSWHLALSSWLLAKHLNRDYSIEKLLKLALIHDLGEIDPGDTFLYSKNRNEAAKLESECVCRLANDSGNSIDELFELWEEQEYGKSPEAKFLKVVDRLIPFLHNITSNGKAWKDNDISVSQVLNAHKFIESEEPEIYSWFKQNLDHAVKKGWLKSS
ncbi:MAG: HD domain-containing protein [Chlorobiales bacterium]|nr:HD domain-containing protein [Chlorobiales bacterium]